MTDQQPPVTPTIELIQPLLGATPYLLLEIDGDGDGDTVLRFRGGGGIATPDQITLMLLMAIEETTGVGADTYLDEINTHRHTQGQPPLTFDDAPEPS